MRTSFRKIAVLLSCLATVLLCNKGLAQQTAHRIILDQMNYLLYLPEDYASDSTRTWPMMVFLHGVGESGKDLEKIKMHGPPKMIEEGYKFPFVVVSPQAQERGWRPEFVQKLVLEIQDKYKVDKDRTYLTGLSMGGFGTWYTAQMYPELFAAILPICGGGDSQNTWSLENMPIWCFHGAKDKIVPISSSQIMIDSLKKYQNPNIKFTIYPDAEHDSWTDTYNNRAIYDWLLSHKRFKYTETPITSEQLHEYSGNYCHKVENGENEHNLQVTITETGKLRIKWSDQFSSEYTFAGNDKFFVSPDKFDYIKFKRDREGLITSLSLVYSKYRVDYSKR